MKKYLLSCIALISFTCANSQRAYEINELMQRINTKVQSGVKMAKFYNRVINIHKHSIELKNNYEEYERSFLEASIINLQEIIALINYASHRIRNLSTLEEVKFQPNQINELINITHIINNFIFNMKDYVNSFEIITKLPIQFKTALITSLENLVTSIRNDYTKLYNNCFILKSEALDVAQSFSNATVQIFDFIRLLKS